LGCCFGQQVTRAEGLGLAESKRQTGKGNGSPTQPACGFGERRQWVSAEPRADRKRQRRAQARISAIEGNGRKKKSYPVITRNLICGTSHPRMKGRLKVVRR